MYLMRLEFQIRTLILLSSRSKSSVLNKLTDRFAYSRISWLDRFWIWKRLRLFLNWTIVGFNILNLESLFFWFSVDGFQYELEDGLWNGVCEWESKVFLVHILRGLHNLCNTYHSVAYFIHLFCNCFVICIQWEAV